jgi:adenylate cyclase 10
MELFVKTIGKSGGDIFKFAGDAMIVVWPSPKKDSNLEKLLSLSFIFRFRHISKAT